MRFIRPRGTAPGPDFISLKNGTALPATAGHKITKATCRQADDSRTDGIGATRLSFPTVGFHIDCLAVNHPEVASDANSLARLFLTDYCKALSRAVLCSYGNFHKKYEFDGFESKERLKQYAICFFKKNRVSASKREKYPVVCTASRACLLSTAITITLTKVINFF